MPWKINRRLRRFVTDDCFTKAPEALKVGSMISTCLTNRTSRSPDRQTRDEAVMKPIKITVEALCFNSNSLTKANTSFKFLFKHLQKHNSDLAFHFTCSLQKRINQRRTVLSDALCYLESGKIDPKVHQYLGTVPLDTSTFLYLFTNICLKNNS
jgi:hypothetical protein